MNILISTVTNKVTVTAKTLLLGALVCTTLNTHALLLERHPQGQYNAKPAPAVNYDELAIAKAHPRAPQADDVNTYTIRVYTYDNNISEYLRDNLGLPRVKTPERLNGEDSTYVDDSSLKDKKLIINLNKKEK